MKKHLALSVLLILLLCLSGCGTGPKAAIFWPETQEYSQFQSILEKQLDQSDISYTHHGNPDASGITVAIESGANLIALCQPDSSVLPELLYAAGETPVIIFGCDWEPYDLPEGMANVCFIGFDPIAGGKEMGRMVGQYVLAHYEELDTNGDSVITYTMLRGDEYSWDTAYRVKFGVEAADAVLTDARRHALSYFDPTTPYKYVLDPAETASSDFAFEIISQDTQAELILCSHDSLALGALDALESQNRSIPVFGFGGISEAQKKLTGTVIRDEASAAYAIACVMEGAYEGEMLSQLLASFTGQTPFRLIEEKKLYIDHFSANP